MKRSKIITNDASGVMTATLLLALFMSITASGFFSWYNLQNLLKDFSILLILASGVTLTIMLGKIDMSVGSVMSLSAIVTTLLISKNVNILLALLAGMTAGSIIGLINGYLIGIQGLNHFVATYATMCIGKGLALVLCNGSIINANSNALLFLGTGKIAGIFFIIWFSLLAFMLLLFITERTSFGYKVYSIGGSEQASKLSGINTAKTYLLAFMVSGLLAAIAGIFMAGKANSGNATLGDGFEFNAIATVIIGGTPFAGGRGGLLGTLVGALFISILKNGLSMLGLTPAWQYAIIGLVILGTITLDVSINTHRDNNERRRVQR